jgi:hypothetical protein
MIARIEAAQELTPSSLANELARLEQALADLQSSDGSEVSLIRCDSPEQEIELVRALSRRARTLAVVTAEISLRDDSLEALDAVVRRLIERLVPPTRSGSTSRRGLVALLDFFGKRHGPRSGARFAEAVEQFGAWGDLAALCQAYVETSSQPRRAALALKAWHSGTELRRQSRWPVVRAALSAKTARRALGDLTKVIRCLGFAGCVFCFVEGDVMTRRTPRQRERAYTVLRELVDNFDGRRGMISARLIITGGARLFEGPRSVQCLPPLLSRLHGSIGTTPVPPHRSWVQFSPDRSALESAQPLLPPQSRRRAVRALIRIAQGLPPVEAVTSMSVGHHRIDRWITKLLDHAKIAGSVFTVLEGEYGAGKTHMLLHLADRALQQRHPVFRLSIERLDFDLGNPQRHLHRLLDESQLPLRSRPSALERLRVWCGAPARLRTLLRVLAQIAARSDEAAVAAARVLRASRAARDPSLAIDTCLSGRDLRGKPNARPYRHDAYGRLLLWIELLRRIERCSGPVLLVDEAESLYTTGVSRIIRRTALRSLSFYCGGALPSACVVLAITPAALEELRGESKELLAEVAEQRTVLPWEDASMLQRRLSRLEPQPVPRLGRAQRQELAERVWATHRDVRGTRYQVELDPLLRAGRVNEAPRVLVRRVMDHLESRWWRSRAVRS